jgi:hypothetical protein
MRARALGRLGDEEADERLPVPQAMIAWPRSGVRKPATMLATASRW